tara:strand:- start:419 stop:595 length:177 start_codon:yes stop_codon:yes gene_type:complete
MRHSLAGETDVASVFHRLDVVAAPALEVSYLFAQGVATREGADVVSPLLGHAGDDLPK